MLAVVGKGRLLKALVETPCGADASTRKQGVLRLRVIRLADGHSTQVDDLLGRSQYEPQITVSI